LRSAQAGRLRLGIAALGAGLACADDRRAGLVVEAVRLGDVDVGQAGADEGVDELLAREGACDAAGVRGHVGLRRGVHVGVRDHVGHGESDRRASGREPLRVGLGLCRTAMLMFVITAVATDTRAIGAAAGVLGYTAVRGSSTAPSALATADP
jgi:hypothetical protein